MKKLLPIIIIAAIVSLCSLTTTIVSADNQGYSEGCPASYWRFTQDWQEYTPQDQIDHLFAIPPRLFAYETTPLILALNFEDDLPDERLLREGVAAFLNAAHEGVAYPYRRFAEPLNIKAYVDDVLEEGNIDRINILADKLEEANNLDCPFVPRVLPDGGDSTIAKMGIGAAVGAIGTIGFMLLALGIFIGMVLRSKED